MLSPLVLVCLLGVASSQVLNTFQQPPQPNNWQQQEPLPRWDDGVQCANQQLRSMPQMPREYLMAHQRFSADLLKHPGFWSGVEQNGVASTNTFTLGHFLALLSTEPWNLPTSNIPKVLKLPSMDKVVDSYAQQFHMFEEEDNKVYPTSYIFTPFDNLRVTPAIERLFTRKQMMNLWKNQQAPDTINEMVRLATRDNIEDELVPHVPPFHEQTAGVVMNSFHYASDWEHEWKSIGKEPFHTPNGVRPMEAMEFSGAFPVMETSTYTAVGVPLEGSTKHAVFVQPTNQLQDYFAQGHVDEIFTNGPWTWPKKNIRIQIPHVNITLAHGFSQLKDEQIQCLSEGGPKPHLLQPIVQVVSFAMTPEELTYSVANGAQVNEAGGRTTTFRHLQQPVRPFSNTPFRGVPIRMNTPYKKDYTSAEVVFDKPFFLYLHDKSLGPFAFHALSSNFQQEEGQRQARHHDSPMEFDEQSKAHRWNCQQ